MLIEFNVENYRSFRDRVRLSLVSAKPEKSLPQNVIPNAQDSKLDLLRTAAIYGANAAGKSNLIKAIGFMRELVLNSAGTGSKDSGIRTTPFKLDQRWVSRPSTFEVVFLWEKVRYVYGFSVDTHRVQIGRAHV